MLHSVFCGTGFSLLSCDLPIKTPAEACAAAC
jgi:hypothetical protein